MSTLIRVSIGFLAVACCSCASSQVSSDESPTYKGGLSRDSAVMVPDGYPMYKCEIPNSEKNLEFTGAPGDSAAIPKAKQLCDCVRSNGILSLYERLEGLVATKGGDSLEVQQGSRNMGVIIDKCNVL
jgi:hypothetical protein